MIILSCKAARFAYNGFIAADNVSFELRDGDYFSVVGENGSGKSTVMKGLLGLQKPAAGSVEFYGIKPREVGYLPQQTPVQKDVPATVWEVALSGCQNRLRFFPFYTAADKERAREKLKYMEDASLASKPYRNLSGGQQQRVLLARALCAASKLLMLDEPVSGLDPAMTGRMYEILNELNSVKKLTILMISHDLESALKYSNKILHLSYGENFFGGKEEYLASAIYKKSGGRYA
jgi:zinc transport system ATP-binding protein